VLFGGGWETKENDQQKAQGAEAYIKREAEKIRTEAAAEFADAKGVLLFSRNSKFSK
jgi:hypothetical protein